MRRHILALLLLAGQISSLGFRANHRRPLAQTLSKFIRAYFQHYRAGYLVGTSSSTFSSVSLNLNTAMIK